MDFVKDKISDFIVAYAIKTHRFIFPDYRNFYFEKFFVVVCDKFNKGLSSIKVEDKFYSDSEADYTYTRLLVRV